MSPRNSQQRYGRLTSTTNLSSPIEKGKSAAVPPRWETSAGSPRPASSGRLVGGRHAHTWRATAANGNFGKKGAVSAAKVLGGTAYALLDDLSILDRASAEFEEATSERSYETPLPPDAEPPFDLASD